MTDAAITYRVRARMLFLYAFLSLIVTAVVVSSIWPSWIESAPDSVPHAVFGLVLYAVLFALILHPLLRSGLLTRLLGAAPCQAAAKWAVTVGIAGLGVSAGCLYLVFLPLSHVWPDTVRWWLLEDAPALISIGRHDSLQVNAINLLAVVVAAPFVEEVFFRGLLLSAWCRRFGVKWGVAWTSLSFAALHLDFLGSFAFGVVTAFVVLKTGNLWYSILIHIANNALVWVLAVLVMAVSDTYEPTVADFQNDWWVGLLGLLIGGPLLLWSLPRAIAAGSQRTPEAKPETAAAAVGAGREDLSLRATD
jgi:membrane protease YdiL (CAAX protease family)